MTDSLQWHPMMAISTGADRQPTPIRRTQTTASSAPRQDRFNVSAIASAFSASAASQVDTLRIEKIMNLKAAIASGTYRVSASDLANALIAAKAI